MNETLTAPRPPEVPHAPHEEVDVTSKQITRLETQFGNESRRTRLLQELVDNELITPEFAGSDIIDKFATDNKTDGMRNILVGGKTSAPHHLLSLAKLLHPNNVQMKGFNRRIKLSDEQPFVINHIEINNKEYKDSVFFPNEWTAQQILENIVRATDGKQIGYNPKQHIKTYEATIDGVVIQVKVDQKNKIQSARPLLNTQTTKQSQLSNSVNKIPKNHSDSTEQLQLNEQRNVKFMNKLIENRLLTPEFMSSGAAEKFQSGKLEHMLVGNISGGAHHLPTLMAMDVEGKTTVASQIYNPNKQASHENQLFAAQMKQGILSNGTFSPAMLEIGVGDKRYKKQGISGFFPNEWTTQQVIENILYVAGTEPKEYNEERHNYVHEATIDGVQVRVIVSASGKIITAFPNMRNEKRSNS